MLGFRAFHPLTLSLHGVIFFTFFMLQRKSCLVLYEPFAIPDGDGSSVPRKSLDSAEQGLSEEGK